MKICLGEEMTRTALDRIQWIKNNFDSKNYKITCDGFLINDYYVEFTEEKYETLYFLRYSK